VTCTGSHLYRVGTHCVRC